MLHAGFILLFMLVAAPLASFIPLAGLAGVLVVVAWNMAEKHAFVMLIRTSKGDAVVLLATFGLTVFVGLAEAIVVGFALGTLLFMHRMAQTTGIAADVPPVAEDEADDTSRPPYNPAVAADPDIAVYRISGAFFFGAAATVGSVLDRIADQHKAFVIDFSAVPFIDSTAANAIEVVLRKAKRNNVLVLISGASPPIRQILGSHGVREPDASFADTLDAGLAAARRAIS
jgi:SulP family sulfate permease